MKNSFQDLLVLTSPPASGKTFWINCLKKELGNNPILLISPLRALADECKTNWKNSIVVMTPEEWLGNKVFHDVVIFDEFHLFFYWGDSFRPLMWEMFFEVTQYSKLTVLLTATLSAEMQYEIKQFHSQFDQMTWVDQGNQTLKFRPTSYLKVPTRKWLMQKIENEPKGKEVKLIFCEFRQEVLELEKKLVSAGFNCISSIGGESRLMAGKLKLNPQPDFIISTTVLSHGVNLPNITKIFFTYKINNLDFWIQMVARGGRRGESFSVFALEAPQGIKWSWWKNFCWFQWENLKLKIYSSSFLFPKS